MIKNDVLLNEEIDPKLVSFCHIIFYIEEKKLNPENLEHVIYFRNVDGVATKKVLDMRANLKPTKSFFFWLFGLVFSPVNVFFHPRKITFEKYFWYSHLCCFRHKTCEMTCITFVPS